MSYLTLYPTFNIFLIPRTFESYECTYRYFNLFDILIKKSNLQPKGEYGKMANDIEQHIIPNVTHHPIAESNKKKNSKTYEKYHENERLYYPINCRKISFYVALVY